MKKKLLALVLAVMMTVGCFAGLGAAVGQDADFAALSVADQYAAIMAAGSEADAQALFDTLDAEQQAALTAYADQQKDTDTAKETDPIPAVNYTNVAPLVTANKVSQPARARLMSASSTARPIEKGKTVDGLVINKTATANDDGTYNIKLEAYTTGSVSTTESTKPTDIVLVLDQSGSMDEDMKSYTYTEAYPGNNHNGSYYVKSRDSYVRVSWCSDCRAWTDGCTDGWFWQHYSGTKYTPKTSASDTASGHVQFYSRGSETKVKRLTALKKAVTSFADAVAEKAKGADGVLGTDDDVNHRIAVVGFASGNPSNRLYYNSEIFVGANQYQYNRLTSQNYLDAMQSMDTKTGVDNIGKSINALDAEGATYTNLGIEMANGIFATNPVENNSRNRIVVVFTDGQPGRSGYDSSIANAAINQANTTKNTYNATVYTVGIFENADATSAGNQNGTNAEKSNWFMQKLSSNNGTPQDPSYYLSASDSDTLSTIFQKISNQISESKIDLGSQTVIKDTVTKYFDMPTDASKVSVKSYDCTGVADGKPTWSETGTVINNAVTLDPKDNSVNVTGFDFNANYVTEKGRDENDPKKEGDFHGRKLVIEFTVTAKDGFVGGNSVPTNGSDSGVYDKDGKEVATFDVPQVNVPIEPELTVNDKVIYEGGSANVSGLYNAADTSSWKYDFVNVSYEVKNGNTAVSGSVSPADCTDYTVKATFSPKYDGKNADGKINDDVTVDGTATVHVLKPTVTVTANDVWKYYGEDYNTPDGSTVTGSVTWADEHSHDVSGITVIGSAPYGTDDLQYSYDHGQFVVPNTDTTIAVVAKVGGVEKASTSYVVHPKFCTLTINKEVAKLYGDNDSFIFNVVGEGNIKYEAKVVINGAGSATLTGLPVGSYTVTEDIGWSWRYTCDSSTKSTVLSSAKDNDSVTITNKLDDNKYLGDETYVINKCESRTITKVTSTVIRQAIEYILGR
ncbi:MAG TPA: hypothetical protein DIT84_09550 [Clostridiales bacterium]|nr:hypothetical protein [Clostridiales bacterium]